MRLVCIRLVECCFTSTETVGLLGTGAQDGHLDFHTAPELCMYIYILHDVKHVFPLSSQPQMFSRTPKQAVSIRQGKTD